MGPAAGQVPHTSAWCISGVTLIDGTGAAPMPETTIVIDKGRFAWIGPDAHAPTVADVSRYSAAGRSVVPGLINSHVHLSDEGTPDLAASLASRSGQRVTLQAASNARETLNRGITTVRDCGAKDDTIIQLGAAIADGVVPGPRVVAAGRVLTMTGGHGHFIGREVDGASEARKGVREQLKCGAGFIKTMATGGVLTLGRRPEQIALMPDELTAIVDEANNAGVRVAAHAQGRQGIVNALSAGVSSIEHGYYFDEELFTIALDKGVFLVPTLLALDRIIECGPSGGTPAPIIGKALEEREQSRQMFAQAVRSGLKIAAGTDAGTPFNPHTDLAAELLLMQAAGLEPLTVISSATLAAAQNMDLDHRLGSIEVGKSADLVLCDDDPLVDLAALREPTLVVKEGLVVYVRNAAV